MTDLSAASPVAGSPLAYFADLSPDLGDFSADIAKGLSAPQKNLPAKYFYDAVGSSLFDEICQLNEYYLTRTEMQILRDISAEMSDLLGPRVGVLEYGSGSSTKVRVLLDALSDPLEYAAIDISGLHLRKSVEALSADYPDLRLGGICADFTAPLDLPSAALQEVETRLGFLPGSTLGNFEPDDAQRILRQIRQTLGEGELLLIGVDLKKDRETLLRAYDDREGVTAAFNLNILRRICKELDAELDLNGFAHLARYNDAKGRIEMHLQARGAQTIRLGEEIYEFADGETIHTENSHKFHIEEFQALATSAGFAPVRCWTDEDDAFSVHLLRA